MPLEGRAGPAEARSAAALERPDLYVVARFLEALWREEGRRKRTELQAAVRLNYDVYRKYLAWLVDKDLVRVAPDAEGVDQVAITPRGLEAYHQLVAWIKDTVGTERL